MFSRPASNLKSAASSHTLTAARQLPLFMEATLNLPSAEEELSGAHGEVFTRRWVVELILDLVGYTADRDLGAMIAVEPACGSGAFVAPMVERLLESARLHGRSIDEVGGAVQACDLLTANVAASRGAVSDVLVAEAGLSPDSARDIAEAWISRNDFLLSPPAEASVDFVVGNPPYIRLESVPRERSDSYRRACLTMGGRADVYVGFYELGLLALRQGGTLGFICADRWMRNAYGSRLRGMVSEGWSVEAVVSMTAVDVFEEEVDAYPAITVISRAPQERRPLVVEADPSFSMTQAREVSRLAEQPVPRSIRGAGYSAARLSRWVCPSLLCQCWRAGGRVAVDHDAGLGDDRRAVAKRVS